MHTAKHHDAKFIVATPLNLETPFEFMPAVDTGTVGYCRPHPPSPVIFIMLAAPSGKRGVTVWRLSVCLSTPVGILTVTHQGAAFDAAGVHLDPTIRRTYLLTRSFADVGSLDTLKEARRLKTCVMC